MFKGVYEFPTCTCVVMHNIVPSQELSIVEIMVVFDGVAEVKNDGFRHVGYRSTKVSGSPDS